jgi:hypothetical protein
LYSEITYGACSWIGASIIRKKWGAYNLYVDGLKIYTTIDFDATICRGSVGKSHMQKLQQSFESNLMIGNNMMPL